MSKSKSMPKNNAGPSLIIQIRQLEKSLILDPTKQVNSILVIRDYLKDTDQSVDVRLTSMHALRRIFIEFIESGRMTLQPPSSSSAKEGKEQKVREYKQWLHQQLLSYQQILVNMITTSDEAFIAPCVRTMLQFVSREYFLTHPVPPPNKEDDAPLASRFGFTSYSSVILAFLHCETEIDVDVLLMLRAEVFDKGDCAYYALRVIKTRIKQAKEAATRGRHAGQHHDETLLMITRNALDLLRVISLPTEIDQSSFLLQPSIGQDDDGDSEADGNMSQSDNDDYDDENDDEGKKPALKRTRKGLDPASRSSVGLGPEAKKHKRASIMTSSEQLLDTNSHRVAYSKAWLALLSVPLTIPQHKAVLKHLPDHVIGDMVNPLLLADYLTQTFSCGGILAVLALEGLFQLIVRFNLDYPRFFDALLDLCSVETLTAKYRSKFMRLLCASLRSTNLPSYQVATFIKRLMTLALHVPTPSAMFCIAQCTWLLRQHPACHVLVHRPPSRTKVGSQDSAGGKEGDQSDREEALQSSLWEAEALMTHHMHGVSTLAAALQSTSSTAPASAATATSQAPIRVEDYVESSFLSLMEAELSKVKKHSALAHVVSKGLVDGWIDGQNGDLISRCFL